MQIDDAWLKAVRIERPDEIRRAAEALRDAARSLTGLGIAITHNIASPSPIRDAAGVSLAGEVFDGMREAHWWTVPQLAFTSPIAMASRFEGDVFWANAKGFRTRSPNQLLAAIDLTQFEKRALTKAAIAVPVHLPFGQIGLALFVSPDPAVDELGDIYARHGEALALLARTFLTSYAKATERRTAAVGAISLSKREVECLRWAAAGKTNDEIAIILGLKRTTIRFHTRTAAAKLDAVNRDQALFRAAQLGFLGTLR